MIQGQLGPWTLWSISKKENVLGETEAGMWLGRLWLCAYNDATDCGVMVLELHQQRLPAVRIPDNEGHHV